MTRKIREHYDIPNVYRLNNHVGLEIEYEGIAGDLDDLAVALHAVGWSITADHSLRNNGAEFISVPTHINRVQARQNALATALRQFEKTPDISHRCSTHIHVNVADKTLRELEAAYFLFLLLEDSLFDRLPFEERKDNLFALRTSYYGDALAHIISMPEKAVSSRANVFLQTDHFVNIKYMGVSVYRTRQIGTVEFRILPAFPLEQMEAGALTLWARIFLALMRGVADLKTFSPLAALSDFMEVCNGTLGVSEYLHRYYDKNSAEILASLFNDDTRMLEPENSSILLFLAELLSHPKRYE